MTDRAEDFLVRPCDIFLLERWRDDSSLTADEQVVQIFAEFNKLPIVDRQVYKEQLRDRRIRLSQELPPDEQSLLSRVLEPRERRGTACWLRTYYGSGSDGAIQTICQSLDTPIDVDGAIMSDATRYDFGDAWQRIFLLMPQLLTNGRVNSEYDLQLADELTKAQRWERADRKEVEEEEGDYAEDGTYWGDLYNWWHYAAKVGVMYVLDKASLVPAEDGASSWGILIAWYDAYGETVRWRRMSLAEVNDTYGLLAVGSYDDHPVWTKAELGAAYDLADESLPPTPEGEGGSDSD